MIVGYECGGYMLVGAFVTSPDFFVSCLCCKLRSPDSFPVCSLLDILRCSGDCFSLQVACIDIHRLLRNRALQQQGTSPHDTAREIRPDLRGRWFNK